MPIKVAVVGPKDLVDKTLEEGGKYRELVLVPYIYKSETETIGIVNKGSKESDLILFTGPIPYYIASKANDINIPMIYISYSGTAFYRTLFSNMETLNFSSKDILRFSIDTIHRENVEEMLDELGLERYEINVKDYEGYITSEEIVDYHYKLFVNGKTDFAITCLTSAYEKIKELGMTCCRIIPTSMAIRQTLELASLEAKSLVARKAQLCAGVVKILNWNNLDSYSPSEYEQQRMKLTMTELFINFCEKMKASMKFVNEDEYRFYATRGAVESATDNYKFMPLIQDINHKLPFTVCVGLGYGYSANEGEKNSSEALKYAISYNKNSCYVVMEDGKIKGPLEQGKAIEFYSKSEEDEIIKLSEKSNVSVMTLSKISGIMKSLNKDVITANEIADTLSLTLRSARRILASLEEAGIAVAVGEEQPAGRGRPRQIFKISF
jgi:ribosomal protein S25